MNRKTKIAAIAAIAAIGVIGTAGAASASVNVDATGAGHVGKGDVQSALGLKNDDAMQDLFNSTTPKGAAINFTFGGTSTFVSDYEMYCLSGGTGHRIITNTSSAKVEAEPNTNKAGKLTDGWNLTSNGYNRTSSMVDVGCEGSFLYMNTGVTTVTTTTTGSDGLHVNGIPLPNTPVTVAPVA